jgi:hypothetical protein
VSRGKERSKAKARTLQVPQLRRRKQEEGAALRAQKDQEEEKEGFVIVLPPPRLQNGQSLDNTLVERPWIRGFTKVPLSLSGELIGSGQNKDA